MAGMAAMVMAVSVFTAVATEVAIELIFHKAPDHPRFLRRGYRHAGGHELPAHRPLFGFP